jgi:hypothetical protein
MLNKIRPEPEILASKVDHSKVKKKKHFLLNFAFDVLENWQVTRGFMV